MSAKITKLFPKNSTCNKYCNCGIFAFVFALLLVLPNLSLYAQKQGQPYLDSLLKELPRFKEDSKKVELLGKIADLYVYFDISLLFKYTNQQLELAERLHDLHGLSNAYNKLSKYYRYNAQTEKAISYQEKAIKIQEAINDNSGLAASYENNGLICFGEGKNPEAINNLNNAFKIAEDNNDFHRKADILLDLGNIYSNEGILPEALKHYFNALNIYESINFKLGIADCNNNIGLIYNRNTNFEDALKYLNVALKTDEEIGYKSGMADCYTNIGDIYKSKGDDSLAVKFYNKELQIANESGYKEKILDAYISLGQLFEKEGKFDAALSNYDVAKAIALEIEDKSDLAALSVNIGNIYLLQKKFHDAELFNSKGLELSQEVGFQDGIKEADSNLSAVYELTGRYKEALESFRKHIQVRDSMYNKENTKKLVQTQMQYDFDKKEAVTQEQIKRGKVMLAATAVGGVLVLFIAIIALFAYRQKQKDNAIIAKEKQRSDDLLLNILPEEVASELKEKGSAIARHFPEVTVLFTDFKGFTKLAEKMTPQQLVAELDTCFRGFDAIIQKYNLEKIKTIGDAYMAVAGLPKPNQDHAYLMVKAGIEIRDFIVARKEKMGELAFDVRVGVHSGDVVAGIVGFKKFAYDIWGDTVNTASRMESSGEPGQVNISGTTYELVKSKFACTYRGKLAAKNKGEMDMYFVEHIDHMS